jgi:hypothetical protein
MSDRQLAGNEIDLVSGGDHIDPSVEWVSRQRWGPICLSLITLHWE